MVGSGDWDVKKFDRATWDRRFSHLVEPTIEIAAFVEMKQNDGQLDTDAQLMLNTVIEHHKATSEWLGLPYYGPSVSEEEKSTRWQQELNQQSQVRSQKAQTEVNQNRLRSIAKYEGRVKADISDKAAWTFLAMDYELEGRFKDVETALRNSDDPRRLGKLYFAALSTSVRGVGVPTWSYNPIDVPSESLGYSREELRSLTIDNLRKAQQVYSDDAHPFSMEIELAIQAADQLSDSAFDDYDAWIAKKQEEDRK